MNNKIDLDEYINNYAIDLLESYKKDININIIYPSIPVIKKQRIKNFNKPVTIQTPIIRKTRTKLITPITPITISINNISCDILSTSMFDSIYNQLYINDDENPTN
jgi:hypothetical protein